MKIMTHTIGNLLPGDLGGEDIDGKLPTVL